MSITRAGLLDRPRTDLDAEFAAIIDELTRRGFLAGGAALGTLGLGVAACGSSGHAGKAAATGWTFTDDRGKRLNLRARPTRIACIADGPAAALWACGLRPVAAADSGGGTDQAVGVNFSQARRLPLTSNDIDLEALAATRPDLLVDTVALDGSLQTTSKNPQVAHLAPVAGLSMYRPVQQIVASAERLTAALGVKLADTAARSRYDAALAQLRAAITANPDLRVGFVFGATASEIGVMNPVAWPVLQTARGAGMKLVPVPAGPDNEYAQLLSWEQAPSIPADFLVWSVSSTLPANPLWKAIPAVKAGQWWKPDIASWYAYSYANYASLLASLATQVRHARPGIGPRQ